MYINDDNDNIVRLHTPKVSFTLFTLIILTELYTFDKKLCSLLDNIECPPAMDGMERFACPSPDRQGRYRCIDDHVLCDGFIDCPDGEDEERQACMFYKTVSLIFGIRYFYSGTVGDQTYCTKIRKHIILEYSSWNE